MKNIVKLMILAIILNCSCSYAYDTRMSPELYRAYGKQQIKTKDRKGNTILVTPNFKDYAERNEYVSEKVVCIENRRAYDPYYGYLYTLYTPIGKYVGYHKQMQPSLNGYGYDPIECGAYGDGIPKFKTIQEARHYYYPNWY